MGHLRIIASIIGTDLLYHRVVAINYWLLISAVIPFTYLQTEIVGHMLK